MVGLSLNRPHKMNSFSWLNLMDIAAPFDTVWLPFFPSHNHTQPIRALQILSSICCKFRNSCRCVLAETSESRPMVTHIQHIHHLPRIHIHDIGATRTSPLRSAQYTQHNDKHIEKRCFLWFTCAKEIVQL